MNSRKEKNGRWYVYCHECEFEAGELIERLKQDEIHNTGDTIR